jgi:lysosomal Pro-X carboxypeptidase
LDFYGGKNAKRDFKHCSYIFFSNGKIDPWSAGGVLEQVSDTCPSIMIELSAHHYDLRAPNDLDTKEVREARVLEDAFLK